MPIQFVIKHIILSMLAHVQKRTYILCVVHKYPIFILKITIKVYWSTANNATKKRVKYQNKLIKLYDIQHELKSFPLLNLSPYTK